MSDKSSGWNITSNIVRIGGMTSRQGHQNDEYRENNTRICQRRCGSRKIGFGRTTSASVAGEIL